MFSGYYKQLLNLLNQFADALAMMHLFSNTRWSLDFLIKKLKCAMPSPQLKYFYCFTDVWRTVVVN